MTPVEPAKHYGFSLYRADDTACGKQHADVVFTFNRERVTCDVCIEELKLQADQEPTPEEDR